MQVGLNYGFGDEIKNTDYTYTNHYIKGQLYWQLSETKHFTYVIVLQPEINFATHQLLNLYFVTPDEPDFEEKREAFTKLKDIREYVLGVGFQVRYKVTPKFNVYAMGSVGPMITDTETERLSKGFAFSDVFSLGMSYKFKKFSVDFRPNLRHISNAGLQSSNAGFNTANVEFGVAVPL
ncbi:acyloxyacyl hydrolase [Flavobacterium sp. BFFFF1]|nr:acyloxyacyl hydrolase [Flavobacterium sp. BFFFF1]